MGNNTFLLVGNGPYSNRGCEAIVRGTVKILRYAFEDIAFVNANFDVADPPFVPVECDLGIIHHPLPHVRRLTPRWAAVKIADRLCPSLGHRLQFGSLRKDIELSRAALSIGGDNYSLDYGIPRVFIQIGKYLKKCGIPIFIWGASIGPFDKNPAVARSVLSHLQQDVSAIFVREERSWNDLSRHGLARKVHLMPDPAFVMDPVPVNGQKVGFDIQSGAAIGLNISPLMVKYIPGGDMNDLILRTGEIVKALRCTFCKPIVLIPHVTSPHSDDHAFLRSVYDSLKGEQHIYCLPNSLSAAETKWVISQLHCLIAARTHATIAGFSSCVGTVSIAYSRKAYGLNELVFGHADYVLSPAELVPDRVIAKVDAVLRQESTIRNSLTEYMKNVQRQAREAASILKHILASGSK